MRVLVTGGGGFSGSHLVDQLLEGGHHVTVLDWADPAGKSWGHAGVDYRQGDVADTDAWLDALNDVDAVCHQAAKVGLGVRASDVRDYVASNDVGTAAGL